MWRCRFQEKYIHNGVGVDGSPVHYATVARTLRLQHVLCWSCRSPILVSDQYSVRQSGKVAPICGCDAVGERRRKILIKPTTENHRQTTYNQRPCIVTFRNIKNSPQRSIRYLSLGLKAIDVSTIQSHRSHGHQCKSVLLDLTPSSNDKCGNSGQTHLSQYIDNVFMDSGKFNVLTNQDRQHFSDK